jgi:hypothetical protein
MKSVVYVADVDVFGCDVAFVVVFDAFVVEFDVV